LVIDGLNVDYNFDMSNISDHETVVQQTDPRYVKFQIALIIAGLIPIWRYSTLWSSPVEMWAGIRDLLFNYPLYNDGVDTLVFARVVIGLTVVFLAIKKARSAAIFGFLFAFISLIIHFLLFVRSHLGRSRLQFADERMIPFSLTSETLWISNLKFHVIDLIQVFVVIALCAYAMRYAPPKLKSMINNPETKGSNKNLILWYITGAIISIVGVGAYLIDINNPSELDWYTDTNDSANYVLLGTILAVVLIGIGARFSYMKYSRIDQAQLIAVAIQTNNLNKSNNSPVSKSPNSSKLDELDRLVKMRADSVITESEFLKMKLSILDDLEN